MNPIRHKVSMLIAIAMLQHGAYAIAHEAAESPAPADSSVVTKVENAVERGAKAAARGIERGAKATARGVKRGVNAAAHGVERGAKATDNAAHRVARKISGSPAPHAAAEK